MDLFNLPFFRSYEAELGWLISRVANVETSEANAKASEEAAADSASDAQTAEGLASTYKNQSKDYRDEAQGFANDAQDSADSIAGVADQVRVNTEAIDQIISSATPADADIELTNIRIAANGDVYETAGNSVRGQFNDLIKGTFTLDHVIQGGIDNSGIHNTWPNRLKSDGFLQVKKYDVVHFAPGTNIGGMSYAVFNSGGTYDSSSSWITTERNININFDGYIVPLFRKSGNNENITPSDYDATLTITHAHSIETDQTNMNYIFGNVGAHYPSRNAINIYFGGDDCGFEERTGGTGSAYLRVGNVLNMRSGINGVTDDAAYARYYQEIHLTQTPGFPTYEDCIGTPLVTSPGGMSNCIEIPAYNSLVMDLTTKRLKIVSRTGIGIKDIVLLTNYYGKFTYMHPYLLKLYTDQKIGDSVTTVDDTLRRLKNARHVVNNMVTPLTLLHFSDIHEDTGALSRIIGEANQMAGNINDMICTGDMVAHTAGSIASWWNSRVLTTIGNHDAASFDGNNYNWNALTMAEKDAYYIAPFESNWNITHTAGTSYYYKDYTTQRVRLIVLDAQLYWNTNSDASTQTTWLAAILNEAIVNNYAVLIAIHAPAPGAPVEDCSFSRYHRTNMEILTDSFTPPAVISVVAAAINNGLEFIGYLCGHNHQDYIFKAAPGQLGFCVTCANVVNVNQWKGSDQDRDATMDAYNLVTVDPYETTVKIIRGGGADCDNLTRDRVAICYNYTTGELVGEIK